MKNFTYLLSIGLVAGALLTGCNGNNDTTPSASPAPSASASPAPSASASPAPSASASPAPSASASPKPSNKPPVGGECETCLPC